MYIDKKMPKREICKELNNDSSFEEVTINADIENNNY